jgi:hypothetical protein
MAQHYQLDVLRRQLERPRLRSGDRAFLAAAGRLVPPRRRHDLLVTPLSRNDKDAGLRNATTSPRAPALPDVRPVLGLVWGLDYRRWSLLPKRDTCSGSHMRRAQQPACTSDRAGSGGNCASRATNRQTDRDRLLGRSARNLATRGRPDAPRRRSGARTSERAARSPRQTRTPQQNRGVVTEIGRATGSGPSASASSADRTARERPTVWI